MARRKNFSLSRDAIAEAGLALFRSGGAAAVTTRRLAAELGASPMSLYVHVGNKQGLLDAIVERLMVGVKIDLDSEAAWTAQAEQWAHGLREQLLATPGAMELLGQRRWAVVRCTEPLMRALLAAGISEASAVRAVRLLTWSTLGFLCVEAGVEPLPGVAPGSDTPDEVDRSLSRLRELEGRGDSLPASDARGVKSQDIDALFELQTQLLVEGLARRAGEAELGGKSS
jgi:AcrR family transcriptional regulator